MNDLNWGKRGYCWRSEVFKGSLLRLWGATTIGILNRLGLSPKGEEAVLVEVLENLVLVYFFVMRFWKSFL